MTEQTAAADYGASSFWTQVRRWIRWIKIGFFSLVALFFVVLFIEAARLYTLAGDIHPLLGFGVLILLLGAALVIAIPLFRFLRVPRVVSPPAIPDAGELELRHIKRELRYLDRYLACCIRNPEFSGKLAQIEDARQQLSVLSGKVRASPAAPLTELSEELARTTDEILPPLLKDIDAKAEKLIYQEALNVGLATAASPNGTLDAFVMLWRSVNLASKLAVLYYGRPGVLGTLAVCRDVSIATVTAAAMQNVTESLGSVLAKSVGGMTGLVAGPAVDGVTNALVLVRIGYLTQERCRSVRRWDATRQKSALIKALRATQKVAVGLTAEILRQVGTTLGSVVDAAAEGVAKVANTAAESFTAAAESAINTAAELGKKFGSVFKEKKTDEDEAPEQNS